MRVLSNEELNGVEISVSEECYTIYSNKKYFKMGLPEGELFQAIYDGMDSEEIQKKLGVSETELMGFVQVLKEKNIIGKPKKEKKKLLFYQIPLFEADTLITEIANVILRHSSLFKILFIMFNIVTLLGVVSFSVNRNLIFSFESIKLPILQYVVLYVSLIFSVVLHEFSHGLTCKLFGGRVGKIGFIFILFTPAFYCDVSGIRMFNQKYKQVLTTLAGIYMNLFLLSVSALIFAATKQPIFATFSVMQMTFIFSNILPFIRLDGYWFLSFATGITNLYEKGLHGIHYIWKGKNFSERFIGVYGLVTWILMISSFIALGSLVIELGAYIYGVISQVM